ncbi:DUF2804 domain-containing protein [Archangium lansingense]|uniref:DUF2804 domain-containing protein n=1 Tax=Archangium lansingense TaxID=2995310 RepID=UPI003B76D0C5
MPSSLPTSCPELTAPVDLCLANGRLNPAAVGHSRRPLHRTNLAGWGRTKRWEYWGIVTPTHVIGVTVSSLDYAGVHQFYLLDRVTGIEREEGALVPLAAGVTLPDAEPPLTVTAKARHFDFAFTDKAGGTRLRASLGGLELDVFAEDAGESLSVVVPWSDTRFQYTVKDLARPVSGVLRIDGVEHSIPAGDSWAVLDRGRGKWPYRMTWNWAAGSGVVEGHRLGLQLGGKWTDGTGSTENALIVDGVLHFIPEELRWEYDTADWMAPWRVHGERVDATLTPFHVRHAATNALVIASSTHQAFGVWSGWATDTAGNRFSVDGLVGWAEQAANRW